MRSREPAAGEFGHGGSKRHAALGDSQPAKQRRPIFAAILVFFGVGGNLLERPVGAFLDESGQKIPFGNRQPAQKGAVAEQRGHEGVAFRGRAPGPSERGTAPVFRLGKRRLPSGTAEPEQAWIGRTRQRVILSGDVG